MGSKLASTVLTMIFATMIFSTLYRLFNLADPKDVLFLFSTSMFVGWVTQKILVYAILRGSKKN